MEEHERYFLELLDVLERHPAKFRMFLDQLKLFFRQAALLQQDVIRNSDLADVVEQPCDNDVVRIRIVQTQGYRDTTVVFRHAIAVTAGVGIAQVDQRDQRASHRENLFALSLLKVCNSKCVVGRDTLCPVHGVICPLRM